MPSCASWSSWFHESSRRRRVRGVWTRRAERRRVRRPLRARPLGRRARARDRVLRRRHPRRSIHPGDRADARRRAALAHRQSRRRRQHDRRRGRLAARHLRVELSRAQQHRRRRAGVWLDPRARSPHSGQRRRPARRPLEQEGVLEGARAVRPHARAAWLRQHRAGDGAARDGVRDDDGGVEPAVRARRRGGDRRRCRATWT